MACFGPKTVSRVIAPIKRLPSIRRRTDEPKSQSDSSAPWDTVEAYAMPVEELKRGIDWVLWPMVFGDLILSPRVRRACHALSLDDERTTFHPLRWDEVAEADMVANDEVPSGRITQVWFAGVHSNIGGGYPEDQLATG